VNTRCRRLFKSLAVIARRNLENLELTGRVFRRLERLESRNAAARGVMFFLFFDLLEAEAKLFEICHPESIGRQLGEVHNFSTAL
jgi:hypothetical protein